MKLLFMILMFSFSLNVSAVDITITLTTAQATRLAAACGELTGKMTTPADPKVTPPVPRPCTLAESKQMMIDQMKSIVISMEGAKQRKTAVEAVVVPTFDPN